MRYVLVGAHPVSIQHTVADSAGEQRRPAKENPALQDLQGEDGRTRDEETSMLKTMKAIQIIVPTGFLGAADGEPTLNSVLREIAVAFARQPKDWGADRYGADFENEVFSMRPDFQDDECSCGFDKIADQWFEVHPHANDCYYEDRLRRIDVIRKRLRLDELSLASACDIFVVNGVRFDDRKKADKAFRRDGGEMAQYKSPAAEAAHGLWCKAFDKARKLEDSAARALCRRFGIPWNGGCGSAVHCTCGRDLSAKEYFTKNDHAPICKLELPCFLYKPTSFRVDWYKYIGRDMKPSRELSEAELTEMLQACLASKLP